MILRLHQNEKYQEHFLRTERHLRKMLSDPTEFEKLSVAGSKFTSLKNAENRLSLLRSGYISREMFNAILSGGESFSSGPAAYIWKRLVDAQIFLDTDLAMPGAFVTHTIIKPLLQVHFDADTFRNLLAPPSELPSRYADAIVSIDTTTTKGDIARGTGFVLAMGQASVVVTCAHNIEGENISRVSRVRTCSGLDLPFNEPTIAPELDIAFWRAPDFSPPGSLFRLASEDPSVFDEVFTLGYPLVPRAQDAPLLSHRGEVNGTAALYSPRTSVLVISNSISPGSSGCPVIRSDGFVVGMAAKWLEAEYGSERARYSAAIPCSVIQAFFH